ncbi:MAG: hypothetical protein P0Y55_04045 [Candidatus Cohnella colombiensis]|uniref:Uncharacterized protein n=1 Tax=Candidatus Cohnella colombiensis TaxID=3121368 RepID=A0AA95EYA7_9BACL|nr:MAG: hypothetical protein P0Y55_04045 [Cohnella sp.]
MNFAMFIFFSTLEVITFFCFVLVLFRFPVKPYIWQFTIVSFMLSLVSNSLQQEELQQISSIVQIVLCICFVVFFLKVHYFNAMMMIITGYIVVFIIQSILLGVFLHYEVFTSIKAYTVDGYIVQTISSSLVFLFSLLIYVFKGGFSFIDSTSRFKRQKLFVRENRVYFIFLVLAILIVAGSNFIYQRASHPPFLMISVILTLALVALLSLSIKKDELLSKSI